MHFLLHYYAPSSNQVRGYVRGMRPERFENELRVERDSGPVLPVVPWPAARAVGRFQVLFVLGAARGCRLPAPARPRPPRRAR